VPKVGDIALGFGAAVAKLLKLALGESENSPVEGEGATPGRAPVSATEG
jgi:hypothetical protein